MCVICWSPAAKLSAVAFCCVFFVQSALNCGVSYVAVDGVDWQVVGGARICDGRNWSKNVEVARQRGGPRRRGQRWNGECQWSGTVILCGMLSAGVTLRRPFQPPVRQPAAAAGSTNEDMLQRSEFPGQRYRCVEQSAGCATFTGHVTGHF